VVLHRGDLPEEDVEERAGFRVTTPARTLVDLAGSATDADQLDAAFQEALERRLTTPRQVRAVADRVEGRSALEAERALGRLGR
jgi:hypothetical protein